MPNKTQNPSRNWVTQALTHSRSIVRFWYLFLLFFFSFVYFRHISNGKWRRWFSRRDMYIVHTDTPNTHRLYKSCLHGTVSKTNTINHGSVRWRRLHAQRSHTQFEAICTISIALRIKNHMQSQRACAYARCSAHCGSRLTVHRVLVYHCGCDFEITSNVIAANTSNFEALGVPTYRLPPISMTSV